MSVFHNNVIAGAAGQGGAAAEYVIPKSLRFSEDDSANLKRTPSTAGNRVTWTWSAWVKRTKSSAGSTYQTIFSCGVDGNNNSAIVFDNSDKIEIWNVVSNSHATRKITSQVFRDFSSWYHFVVSATSSTLKLYVNGVEVTDWDTDNEPGGENWAFNSANAHYLGHYWDGGSNFKGDFLLADVQFVDGQAKDESDFGETRSTDGVWVPKKYTGTYGTNGFHLDFSDNSTNEALGFDSGATVPTLDPKKGMDVVTYTGNGGTQNIGGLNFEPGLIWLKSRSESARSHSLYDNVRGASKVLKADNTDAEVTMTGVTSFNPDGFTLGSHVNSNNNNVTYVAWNWRAGGPAVSNTDGTITSQVSANTDYGFSIVTYTGGTSDATIGHGLGQTPKFYIVKARESTAYTDFWSVYHTSLGGSAYIKLNENAAASTGSTIWNSTAPTSTVFSVDATSIANENNTDYVAYVWSEVSGYSKFGSYTGNGSSTGPVITTGFKVRWLLVKRTDSGSTDNWALYDSERDSVNPNVARLFPNLSNAESTNAGNAVDFLDDGFQPKSTSDGTNANGGNYIYAAFADRPGNNWKVNNLVTNEGLSTSKDNFDVVTWTGNGGNLKIGGEVYSSYGDNTNINSSYPWTKAFDGVATGVYTAGAGAADGAGWARWTPPDGIAVSSSLRINTDNGTTSAVKVKFVGQTVQHLTSLSDGWTTVTGTGTLEYIEIYNSGNTWSYLCAVEVDGTVLLDGTGPGLKFQPDLVWIKDRSNAYSHRLADSVRGSTRVLFSDQTNAEQVNQYGTIDSFNSDGFTLRQGSNNNGDGSNTNNANMVAWCWKAGGTAVSNTDGDITSSVSANPNYGFSIVSYTASGTRSDTIGHGLSAQPKMIIVKNRDQADDWYVYHVGTDPENSFAYYLELNDSAGRASFYSPWDDTFPTSSVFSVGVEHNVNASGEDYIAYCFADVPGYQRIGSYTGNGSSTGPVVVTGFKPRFLIVKRTDSTGAWVMLDSERNPVNPRTKSFYADVSDAEYAPGQNWADFDESSFQLTATYGEVNASGGTYIYLAIGDDELGSDEDCLVDVPNAVTADADETDTTGGYQRGNYATLNPLHNYNSPTYANGNLEVSNTSTGHWKSAQATIGVTSGKWYWESTMSGASQYYTLGVAIASEVTNNYTGSGDAFVYDGRGFKNGPGVSSVSYGATYTSGDTIGVALDLDAGTLVFYKNGVSQGTAFSTGLTDKTLFPQFSVYYTSAVTQIVNFGQRPFKYPIPNGYAALNTTALPAATIADGSAQFETVLWDGDSASPRSITGLEFSPDLVYMRPRNYARSPIFYDAVRGAGKKLYSNLTDAEDTSTGRGYLSSFDSDGFTLTDGSAGDEDTNNSSYTYVAWTWDAGSSTVSNTDGSITSSVRANPTAGFSIVSWTGTGSNATVGHGLNAQPGLVLVKNRTSAASWAVWHTSLTGSQFLGLNTTNAVQSSANYWNSTVPTTSVFSVGSDSSANGSSKNMIAYCFAPVAGYSAFGSYEGNGSTDGPFVYTGFKPAFILVKTTTRSGDQWCIQDTTRDTFNAAEKVLFPNLSSAENTGTDRIDILSNGFKLRDTTGSYNASGDTYIYYAVAENPFQANGGLAR